MTQLVFSFARAARARAFARTGAGTKVHNDILTLLSKHPELSRQEIADLIGLGVQSVCRPVLELLGTGQIVETGAFRSTRYGGEAALVALAPNKSGRKRGGA